MTINFSIVYTIIATTSIDERIQVLEHRVSYLKSIIEKLTLEELFRRRQARLRYNDQLPPLPI